MVWTGGDSVSKGGIECKCIKTLNKDSKWYCQTPVKFHYKSNVQGFDLPSPKSTVIYGNAPHTWNLPHRN